MMAAGVMTPEEIRAVGLRALTDALGTDGTVRFLLQFSRGTGDYPADRQAWVEALDVDTLLEQVKRYEQASGRPMGPVASSGATG
jgi:hypothetical protein